MASFTGIVFALLLAVAAVAAPPKTSIRDVLYRADGKLFEGTARIEWKSFRAADGSEVPQNHIEFSIVRGAVSVDLVPTTNALNSTFYTVRYNSEGRAAFTEYWAVPQFSGALKIRDVRTHATVNSALTSPAALVSLQDVPGLRTELDLRPQRGATWMGGRVAVIGQSGGIEAALGDSGSCVRTDGSTTPCGFAGITYVDNEIPSGVLNGVNVEFRLSTAPVPTSSLTVHRNGVLLQQGSEYILNGSSLIFQPGHVPAAEDYLLASYRVNADSGLVYVDLEAPSGAINGVNRQFRLTHVPMPASSLHVYRNGLLQKQGADFELAVDTITFVPAATPVVGDIIVASYRK